MPARDALPHNNLGVHLSASGDSRGAGRAFREAIRLRPDYPEAHSNLGTAVAQAGRSGRRRGTDTRRRSASSPTPPSPTSTSAPHSAISGDLARAAVLEFREATRLAPEDPDAHCNLGHGRSEISGSFPKPSPQWNAVTR